MQLTQKGLQRLLTFDHTNIGGNLKELMEYREKLLARLRKAAIEFCKICQNPMDLHAKAEGDWSIHQLAFHVRDVEREVYGMRIRRTLNEENPLFRNFDPDAWMSEHYDRGEPLGKILEEFNNRVQETADMLSSAPQETWSRLSQHEALGGELTLQLWVERSLAHIEEHLETLKNAQKT